jgi:hypothetical protein
MDSNTDGSGIVGQLGLNDDTSEYNRIASQIDQALGKISTIKVVKVIAVSNSGALSPVGTVDIQPLVNLVDGLLGSAQPHGTIFNVPYLRLQGGKNAIIIDPQVGDIGFALVCDRDISNVKQNKTNAVPGSFRRFSESDSIYLGGILNDVPDQYIQFNSNGVTIADNHSNVIQMKSGEIDITAVLLKVNGGLKVTGAVEIDGLLTAENGMQLGGNILAIGGGTYAGNFHTTGTITGDTDVISGTISGKLHTHLYLKPTSGTSTPTAGPA